MWQQTWMWSQYYLTRLKNVLRYSSLLRLEQYRRASGLVRKVTSNVEFYKKYRNLALEKFPIMDKSSMQENFSILNSFGLSAEVARSFIDNPSPAFHVNLSKGTAGSAIPFLFSQKEIYSTLNQVLSKILPYRFKTLKVAIFHLTVEPYFPHSLSHPAMDCLYIDLNTPSTSWINELQHFQPNVMIAPVQTLCLLAKLHSSNELNLNVQKIISTAEVLTPLEEEMISTSFKQNVFQLYQCAEGWLGASCEFGTLHLFEDDYYIEKEWVDKQNRRFIPVITALNRYQHPLIRYRMEDILIEKEESCMCGSPLLGVERIVGRCEDILYFSTSGNQTLKPIYSDILRQAIAHSGGGIQKFQVIQYSANHLHIKIQAENADIAMRCIQQQLEKLFNHHLVKTPMLEFSLLGSPSLNQMFRQTQRLLKTTPY